MKLLLLILLLGMCALNASSQSSAGLPPIAPGVPHDLAIWRAAHYSDVRYKLNLTLEKMSPVLKGTIEIRVNVSPGAQASPPASPPSGETLPIILDWRKLSGHETDSTIANVEINGQKVRVTPSGVSNSGEITPKGVTHTFDESNEHLVIRDGVVPGENVIKLDFTSPILTSGSAITRYIDKEDGSEYIYSLFVPSDASTAFPVFDQPDLKARFELDLTTPWLWTAVSNTDTNSSSHESPPGNPNFVESVEGSTTRFHFAETQPISSYVFAFAAGPFKIFNESDYSKVITAFRQPRELLKSRFPHDKDPKWSPNVISYYKAVEGTRFFVRRSQAAKFQPHAAEVFKLTREGIKSLEDYFDFKFPWPKYDLVLIPEFPFGGMEHAGATFLSERGVIFPSEPTANDYISRANLIFHETAHQWFGDTVTMRWFDDLWLKEGFAEFMAYKTLEKTMPQYNAWKAFYERNKPAAYFTDSTRGTTPIYQPIDNLSAAKSAYGNIVYRKAPSFLRQAEFYLGPDKFQTAVRAFLKRHAYANATWQDLVSEFEAASGQDLKEWGKNWVRERSLPVVRQCSSIGDIENYGLKETNMLGESGLWQFRFKVILIGYDGQRIEKTIEIKPTPEKSDFMFCKNGVGLYSSPPRGLKDEPKWAVAAVLPNYQDYGYGIFLLDDKSRDYVLKNIQNEKDDFLRSMMWGSLWDSVREAELDPRQYVELAIKNLPTEKDETITASVLGRVSTAMTYYLTDAGRNPSGSEGVSSSSNKNTLPTGRVSASADNLSVRLEAMLIAGMRNSPTLGQRITYYRAFLNIVSTENGRNALKDMLKRTGGNPSGSEGVTNSAQKNTLPTGRVSASAADIPLKTKDRFDIVTRLAILRDPDAAKLLADLEKTETSDDAKRYAYAAHAAFATKENRETFWNDFTTNKDISESWIEAAMNPFNSPRHSDLSLPYLQRALAELPNLKRNRKIFFVNGWLGAFIGGQKSREALDIVNKFLADNPNLDRDLRLKVLENVDIIERAVRIRNKFGKT